MLRAVNVESLSDTAWLLLDATAKRLRFVFAVKVPTDGELPSIHSRQKDRRWAQAFSISKRTRRSCPTQPCASLIEAPKWHGGSSLGGYRFGTNPRGQHPHVAIATPVSELGRPNHHPR